MEEFIFRFPDGNCRDYTAHEPPYPNLDPVSSHIHPHFVIFNAGQKLAKLDPEDITQMRTILGRRLSLNHGDMSPLDLIISNGWLRAYLRSGIKKLHHRTFVPHALHSRTIILKMGILQDGRTSEVQAALKNRALEPQLASITEDSSEPLFPSKHQQTMILCPLATTRSLKTIPSGLTISTNGKNRDKMLQRRRCGSQMCLTTRATNSSLHMTTSTPVLLLHQVPGTAGSQPGIVAGRNTSLRRIDRGFRAMTGQFSRMTYTWQDQSTPKLHSKMFLFLKPFFLLKSRHRLTKIPPRFS